MLSTQRRASIPSVIRRVLQYSGLAMRNRIARSSVTGAGAATVSLTSYGTRVRTVHLTIESIARGHVRPRRLILWLDSRADLDKAASHGPLRRLVRRGLEIRRSSPMGPHSKYYPYVASGGVFSGPLVTADDDVIYPVGWLGGLLDSAARDDSVIHCYRAHRVEVRNGEIAEYMSWRPVSDTEPRYSNFLTGVSGVIYPPRFLSYLRQRGEGFRTVAPKADDVWVNACAVEAGFKVAQVSGESMSFPVLIGSQKVALWRHNAGGNDAQIRAAYGARVVERILEECKGALS